MGRFNDFELDDVVLTGPRLDLRRWRHTDAERVREVMQDRTMYDFLALPDPYAVEAATEFVTTLGHEGRDDGTGLGCAMVERESRRVVGSAALRLSGDDAEIGYWVAPDARGHGYAAEASATLATFGFDRLALPRVRLACDVGNLASARTALAAGFRFEGVEREGITAPGHDGSTARRGDLARFARLPDDPPEPVASTFPRLPGPGLSDGVVTLRPLAPEDAAEVAECVAGLSAGPGAVRDVDRTTARAGLDWLVGNQAVAAVVDTATGALAGTVTLRLAGSPQVGELGYVVHPLFGGRDHIARALRLLVPWALRAGFARLRTPC